MKALVTGATGFIGSHLVKELVREKHSVRALVLPGEDVSALAIASVCDMVCTPLRLRPPLTRFSVYSTGLDYDVDTALTRKQLGWKTKVPYEEAMERIGEWVKEVYLKQ